MCQDDGRKRITPRKSPPRRPPPPPVVTSNIKGKPGRRRRRVAMLLTIQVLLTSIMNNLLIVPATLLTHLALTAQKGQLLSQLTLVWMAQLLFLFTTSANNALYYEGMNRGLQLTFLALLWTNTCIIFCGYALLIRLYQHSVHVIFNRVLLPSNTLVECLPSFVLHWQLLKPVQCMFRYATARWRVLPDVLVLGEVRCGTTTLCRHLLSCRSSTAAAPAQPPFCLWKHAELDHKETFYFVGHYLGYVNPAMYRMCFPLKLTRWWWKFRQRQYYLFRRRKNNYDNTNDNDNTLLFWTLDGCAQYLTHPAVPHLIAKCYREAGQAPPILVACVRNPVEQAASWWRYEHKAMEWGAQMGLSQWNTKLRTTQYPPRCISSALDYSSSETVTKSFQMAEQYAVLRTNNGRKGDDDDEREEAGGGQHQQCHSTASAVRLPPWAITWPGGQLAGIGRNGRYLQNILRYERVFSDVFGNEPNSCGEDNDERSHGGCGLVPSTSKLNFVNVVPLEFLNDEEKLNTILTSILSQVQARQASLSGRGCSSSGTRAPTSTSGQSLKDPVCSRNGTIHRNASDVSSSPKSHVEPTQDELKQLEQLFREDSLKLGAMTGLKLDWMT